MHKANFLSALTLDSSTLNASVYSSAASKSAVYTFAAADLASTIDLDAVSVAVFTKALENIASLRAQNGGTMSRLTFSDEMISQMRTNMTAALGRIVDVDIAEESTELAKNQVLVQASAAMLAQANSTSDIALMLLR